MTSPFIEPGIGLDLLPFPASALEEHHASHGNRTLSDHNGEEDALRSHLHRDGEPPSQGDFQQPETEEIYESRRHGVARTVKRLQHHHPIGIPDVAVTEDAKTRGAQPHNFEILREPAHERFCKHHEKHAERSQEQHVVQPVLQTDFSARSGCLAPGFDRPGSPRRCESPGRQDDKITIRIAIV